MSTRQERISIALEQVRLIAEYSGRGQVELAAQARRTLDSVCAEWSEERGKFSYPESVRLALRAAGLRQYPV
jgi:hypothetical protein